MRRLLILAVLMGSVAWWATEAPDRTQRRPSSETTGASWSEWPERPLPPRTPELRNRAKSGEGHVRLSVTGSGVSLEGGAKTIRVSGEGVTIEDECIADTFVDSPAPPAAPSPASIEDTARREVAGDWMSGEESAIVNARSHVAQRVSEWLVEAGVPQSWKAPEGLLDTMIVGRPQVESEARDYAPDGEMYRAVAAVDFSMKHKRALVDEYHREISGQRLGLLGGLLGFVLACLGIIVGYVRADEATKGYFTNRLRLLAAAGFGAAGVVLYQWIMRT